MSISRFVLSTKSSKEVQKLCFELFCRGKTFYKKRIVILEVEYYLDYILFVFKIIKK